MKDNFNLSGEDWYRLIYTFKFTDAFLAVCKACGIKHAGYVLSAWRGNQENMDTFDAEVFILNYFGKLE